MQRISRSLRQLSSPPRLVPWSASSQRFATNGAAASHSPRVVNDAARQLFTYSNYAKDDLKLTYVIDKQRGTMDIQHTYVPSSMQGQGVAKRLAEAAFEYAKAHDLKVIPSCSYIGTFLRRNPEWSSQVV